jgi:putative heme-binding domain-containing protein
LVENIVDPNKVISDQYENSIIVLSDGSTVVGRITAEEGDLLHVATNPSAPGQLTMVHQGNIQSRQVSPTSIMPPGLLNAMNPDEVADLLAYILSGGDKKAKVFTK